MDCTHWPRVGDWLVSPRYTAPVGIGQAEQIARSLGCELPTPELVDLIWAHADLRLDPLPRKFRRWTVEEMAGEATVLDQHRRIEEQIAGRPYTLLAGTHKDVVKLRGRLGIYGWHRPDGTMIQPLFFGHAHAWKDYSQGLRLCRRVSG